MILDAEIVFDDIFFIIGTYWMNNITADMRK